MKLGGWNARMLFRMCSKELPGIPAFQPPSFCTFRFSVVLFDSLKYCLIIYKLVKVKEKIIYKKEEML